MKRMYNTPQMSCSKFESEDIITTSIVSTFNNPDFDKDTFNTQVANNAATTKIQKAIDFEDYTW